MPDPFVFVDSVVSLGYGKERRSESGSEEIPKTE